MNIPDSVLLKLAPSADQTKGRLGGGFPFDAEDEFIEILEDIPLEAEAEAAAPGVEAARTTLLKEGADTLLPVSHRREQRPPEEDPAATTIDSSPMRPAIQQMLTSASDFALQQAVMAPASQPSASDPATADRIDPRRTEPAGPALPSEANAAVAEGAWTALTRVRFTVLGRETHFAPIALPAAVNAGTAVRAIAGAPAARLETPPPPGAAPDVAPGEDAPLALVRPSVSGDTQQLPQERAPRPSRADPASAAELRNMPRRETAGARSTPTEALASAPAPAPGEPTQPVASALPPSQLARIASAIAGDGPPIAGPDAPPPAQTPGAIPTQTAGPVRTLNIQLDPAGLGAVRIDLRLSQGSLSVTLRASQDDTAQMLERDRHALMDLLRASGHSPERLTIHAVQDASPAQPDSQPSFARNGSQTWNGGNGPGSGADQGRPSPQQHGQESGRRQFQQGAEGYAQSANEAGRGSDLYV